MKTSMTMVKWLLSLHDKPKQYFSHMDGHRFRCGWQSGHLTKEGLKYNRLKRMLRRIGSAAHLKDYHYK